MIKDLDLGLDLDVPNMVDLDRDLNLHQKPSINEHQMNQSCWDEIHHDEPESLGRNPAITINQSRSREQETQKYEEESKQIQYFVGGNGGGGDGGRERESVEIEREKEMTAVVAAAVNGGGCRWW